MKNFFLPNIDRHGRVTRGVIGMILLIVGIIVAKSFIIWVGLFLVGIGLFVIFEAISKWCILRACGIKTKL